MKLPAIAALSAAILSANIDRADAFFFLLIPGSAIDALGDAITGATGDNCVKDSAKVGDRIRLADGSVHEVQKLSGTSSRCQTSDFPIRALLGPAIPANSSSPTEKAAFGIDLPPGWASIELTPDIRAKGYLFQGVNATIDASLVVSFVARDKIYNFDDFANARKISQEANLVDGNSSGIDRFKFKGHATYQFYTTGTSKLGSTSGKQMMYQTTIIIGKTQIVEIKSWAYPATFEMHKKELSEIGKAISGLS